MIKQIMIPVAAFAITATSAAAFSSDMLKKIDVDLSDTQVAALGQMHELRIDGANRSEMKAVLEEAGLDKDKMKEIKKAKHEVRKENRGEVMAVMAAIKANDYEAFLEAAPDKLAEAIDSEADFALFIEAHELRKAGDHEGAAEIMSELGIEKTEGHGGRHGGGERGGERGEGGEREGFRKGGGEARGALNN